MLEGKLGGNGVAGNTAPTVSIPTFLLHFLRRRVNQKTRGDEHGMFFAERSGENLGRKRIDFCWPNNQLKNAFFLLSCLRLCNLWAEDKSWTIPGVTRWHCFEQCEILLLQGAVINCGRVKYHNYKWLSVSKIKYRSNSDLVINKIWL